MTGPSHMVLGPVKMQVSTCEAGSPFQQFYFYNESFYPSTLVSQGAYSLQLLLSENAMEIPIVAIHPFGGGITMCDSNNLAQNIAFNGTADAPGLLRTPQNLCLSGKCDDKVLGCTPLHVVECNAQDPDQLFLYVSSNGSFVNANNQMCLGLLAGLHLYTAMYACTGPGSGDASWAVAPTYIESQNNGGYCLTIGMPNPGASMVLVDEFGNGELAEYGDFNTDHCFGVC